MRRSDASLDSPILGALKRLPNTRFADERQVFGRSDAQRSAAVESLNILIDALRYAYQLIYLAALYNSGSVT